MAFPEGKGYDERGFSSGSSSRCGLLFVLSKEPLQIGPKYLFRLVLIEPDLIERRRLRIENSGIPSTGKEAGVGSEQQPLRTDHADRTLVHIAQIEVFVQHPTV